MSRATQYGEYPDIGGDHWIESKDDEGEIVILEDESSWRIDLGDQADVSVWVPMTAITVLQDANGYLLVDTDDGEKAHADFVGMK